MLRFIYAFDKSWKVAYGKVHKFIDSHVKRALDQTAKEASLAARKLSKTDGDAGRNHYILLRELAKRSGTQSNSGTRYCKCSYQLVILHLSPSEMHCSI